MEYCILDGEAALLISDGERAVTLGKLPALKNIRMLVCRPENYTIPRGDSFEKLLNEYESKGRTQMPDVKVDILDDSVIFYTSGSGFDLLTGRTAKSQDVLTSPFLSATGKPKGALHTQLGVVGGTIAAKYNACSGMLRQGYSEKFHPTFTKNDPQAISLVPTPLFHVTAMTATSVPYTSVGTKCILMYKWDTVHAMELIQKEKITSFAAVPTMHISILEHPDRNKYDLSSLQAMLSGGAPAPSSFAENVKKQFPMKMPVNGACAVFC